MNDDYPLHAIAIYGRGGASARVRLFQWLEETGLPSVIHDYAGAANARPRTILRHPAQSLASEVRQNHLKRLSIQRLLLHREASPFSRGALERHLLSSAKLGVYDFDDALQWQERGRVISALRNAHQKTISCINAADRVIAGNEVLADFASFHSKDVVIIPSCIKPSQYTVKSSFELNDPPLIGWIGTPGGEVYLSGIATALLELNRRTGARLQIVGGRAPSLGLLEEIVDRFTWTEALSERVLATWDVGIMPLADCAYEQGKCGYKLLQYAASGLPSVASPVGVNESICRELGFSPATSNNEWIEALMAIIEAPSKTRQGIGEAARTGVIRLYSYEVWKDRWLSAVGMALPAGH